MATYKTIITNGNNDPNFKTNIFTIDIHCKEWFDRVNGNSYFSARITLNYEMFGEITFTIPFQYGYGNYYEQVVMEELVTRGYIKTTNADKLYKYYLQEKGIILRSYKQEGCKKKDMFKKLSYEK